MFPTVVRGGKAFAAEQKFRELNRPSEIKRSADKRIKPLKLPQNAVENISNLSSSKYKKKNQTGFSTLSRHRERIDFNRLEKVGREKIEWRDLNKKFTQVKSSSQDLC